MRIAELARRAGVTVRTVRYYVAEGLLPPPHGAGPGRVYTDEHLLQLGAIRLLKEAYLPLGEIRRRLAGLGLAEVRAFVEAQGAPTYVEAVGQPLPLAPTPPTALPYGQPAAAAAGDVRFPLPPRPAARRPGVPLVVPAAEGAGPSLWQRVVLAPGVELSVQLSDDPLRDRAITDLVADATRRLAALRAPPAEPTR